MVKGEKFLWAHLGKCGGNSVHRMFQIINDGSLIIDDISDPGKHRGFPKVKDHRIRLINIRRLPSWLTSHNSHMARHSSLVKPEELTNKGLTWHPKFGIQSADFYLKAYQHETVDRWFRTENLAADFIDIMSQIVPIKDADKNEIYMTHENKNTQYKPSASLCNEIKNSIYQANPVWKELEESIYWNLR